MSEEDRLYHFLKGLQPWVQSELHPQNVQNLVVAIAPTDKLLDYKVGSSKGQEGDDGHAKRNDKKWQRNKAKASEKQGEPRASKSDAPKEKNVNKSVNCFVCGGNHYAKECPLKHQT